jgi:hypothetical protein
MPSGNTSNGSEDAVAAADCLASPGGCSFNWPVLFLFGIVVAAIGGNVLVCLAVRQERKLQSMFNFFLVSLALSDMLSATLVMPLSIVKALIGQFYTILHTSIHIVLVFSMRCIEAAAYGICLSIMCQQRCVIRPYRDNFRHSYGAHLL